MGIDLCEFQGHTLLVLVDYFSNFIEVEHITRTTTTGVSKILKAVFSRYGIPDKVMSDNGPQFASSEYRALPLSGDLNMSQHHHTTYQYYYLLNVFFVM